MKIPRISVRTLLIVIAILAIYLASMSSVQDRSNRLAGEFRQPDSNDVDFGKDRSLNRVEGFHVTNASSLLEILTLRKRVIFSYDASLSHVGTANDCSVVNCRTEFTMNLFGVNQVSHRQDFVSLFTPSNFPLETRVPSKY